MEKLMQPFHLVTYSPWPLLSSFSLLMTLVGSVNWFHNFNMMLSYFGIISLLFCIIQWWRDVVRESTYQGFHTNMVIEGLKLGMILFIISEVFFFISIFWCYLHMFLSPTIEIGAEWPPKSIIPFNPYSIPLLNTIILLSSGISITWTHHSLMISKKKNSWVSLLITVLLGFIFTYFQYFEYKEAMFSISDSVYGSGFFMATGFHGTHVLVGTIFLSISLFRLLNNNFSSEHHFGFEAAAWYWHFVDVVWLFLYLLIYFWSA